ncbi:MAG: amino acid ABC transporter substrate-binding protein [Deltaproteobacteria bacterium]|nr:amino acid ABC transporter substrate-binding protein [Deltaproteobacteria bacterium]
MKRNVSWWLGVALLVTAWSLMSSGALCAAEKKEILIGANLSLTGPLAMDGGEQKWAYEQAVADVNKAGGIMVKAFGKKLPVKLVVADDESDPGKAAAAVENLIKLQKVDLMLSTHSTPLTIPSCVTAEKYKKYYHATTCLLPVWLESKFKWSTMFFFDMEHFSTIPFEIWKSLPEQDKIKNPAMLMEDSLDGRGMGGALRPAAAKYGHKFVLDEPWAIGAKDYSSQILKLKAKKVDALLIFGSPTDCITLVRQMKENDCNIKYVHGYKGTWTAEFWGALKKDAQYILFDGFWHQDFPHPGAKELGQRFFKQYGKTSVSTGNFYATAQTLFQAIEKAGSLDSAKVRDAVLTHEFKGTVMGDIKYRPDGTAAYHATANQWWDGKQMLAYPFLKDGWKVKLAPPWNKR